MVSRENTHKCTCTYIYTEAGYVYFLFSEIFRILPTTDCYLRSRSPFLVLETTRQS